MLNWVKNELSRNFFLFDGARALQMEFVVWCARILLGFFFLRLARLSLGRRLVQLFEYFLQRIKLVSFELTCREIPTGGQTAWQTASNMLCTETEHNRTEQSERHIQLIIMSVKGNNNFWLTRKCNTHTHTHTHPLEERMLSVLTVKRKFSAARQLAGVPKWRSQNARAIDFNLKPSVARSIKLFKTRQQWNWGYTQMPGQRINVKLQTEQVGIWH